MYTTTYIKAGEEKLMKTKNYPRINTKIPYKQILKEVVDILLAFKMLILKITKLRLTTRCQWIGHSSQRTNIHYKLNYYCSISIILIWYVRICRLYLLPKIHKIPLSWREICSSPRWITFLISMFIDLILQPLLKTFQRIFKIARHL
jgi:hypothetical protein